MIMSLRSAVSSQRPVPALSQTGFLVADEERAPDAEGRFRLDRRLFQSVLQAGIGECWYSCGPASQERPTCEALQDRERRARGISHHVWRQVERLL
jgi:hypothetical protein